MARNNNRDEFSRPTKRAIERQARGHCSNPSCRRLTTLPHLTARVRSTLAWRRTSTPPTPDALRDRLRAAAAADLAVFRQIERWPRPPVALTLKVDHVDEALSTQALANAVTTLDDLILIAAHGMAKTTTVGKGITGSGSR